MDVENIVDTKICKEAFEDGINETVVKKGYASKHANEKVQLDAKYTVDTDICKDAFKDEMNETIEVDIQNTVDRIFL